MKNKIIISLLFILLFGCSDKNNDPDLGEEIILIPRKDVASSFELLIVESPDMLLTEETYTATINDMEVDLVKVSDHELLFMMPSIGAGTGRLELVTENKKGVCVFNIIENEVPNTETVLNTELIEPFDNMNSDLDELMIDASVSSEVKTQLESAKQMLDAYLAKYNSLSNAEKMEIAKFFNVNPVFTSDYLDLSGERVKKTNEDYDCFKLNAKKVIITTVSIITFVHYLPHLVRTGPLGSVGALAGFVAGVYAAQAIISAAHEKLLNDCFLPYENALRDLSGNTDNFELGNEVDYTFSVINRDRRLLSTDLDNPNSIVSRTVQKFNTVKRKWNRLKSGINDIVSSTNNWFGSWFGSASSSFKAITYEFQDLPTSSDEIESEGASQFITIEGFADDIDVVYSIASDNSIRLKFNAPEGTFPRVETGTIRYDDGDFVNETTFTVTLTEPVYSGSGVYGDVEYQFGDKYELGDAYIYNAGQVFNDDGEATDFYAYALYFTSPGVFYNRETGYFEGVGSLLYVDVTCESSSGLVADGLLYKWHYSNYIHSTITYVGNYYKYDFTNREFLEGGEFEEGITEIEYIRLESGDDNTLQFKFYIDVYNTGFVSKGYYNGNLIPL